MVDPPAIFSAVRSGSGPQRPPPWISSRFCERNVPRHEDPVCEHALLITARPIILRYADDSGESAAIPVLLYTDVAAAIARARREKVIPRAVQQLCNNDTNAVTTRGYLTRGSLALARSHAYVSLENTHAAREDKPGNGDAGWSASGGKRVRPVFIFCRTATAVSTLPSRRLPLLSFVRVASRSAASPNREALHPYLRYYLAPLYARLKPNRRRKLVNCGRLSDQRTA